MSYILVICTNIKMNTHRHWTLELKSPSTVKQISLQFKVYYDYRRRRESQRQRWWHGTAACMDDKLLLFFWGKINFYFWRYEPVLEEYSIIICIYPHTPSSKSLLIPWSLDINFVDRFTFDYWCLSFAPFRGVQPVQHALLARMDGRNGDVESHPKQAIS